MKLVIFGLGYTASYYGLHHALKFAEVTGTKRGPKTETLGRIKLLPFDGAAEIVDPRVAAAVEDADALLVSAGPDENGDPVLRRLAGEIAAAPKLKKIVYLSTIGVYGDHDGEWIDETAQPRPSNLRSRQRLAAEAEWFALARAAGKEVYALRLSGIYGPGRNVLVKLREGGAKRLIKPGQVFNRIHVEDIAQAIDACFTGRAPGGVFNVTDDEPAPPQDVVTYAAELVGLRPPPETPFEETPLTPMQRSFYSENKRVSNRRMKALLDLDLAYPTYREGVSALAEAGEGG